MTTAARCPGRSSGTDLLFTVSVVPGHLPVYRVYCCSQNSPRFQNQIYARKIGMQRVEFGNSRFRMVIDRGRGVVEAYNLTAEDRRVVNLVETTPESAAALKDDIHETERRDIPPVLASKAKIAAGPYTAPAAKLPWKSSNRDRSGPHSHPAGRPRRGMDLVRELGRSALDRTERLSFRLHFRRSVPAIRPLS
jgi:hypothetical protein